MSGPSWPNYRILAALLHEALLNTPSLTAALIREYPNILKSRRKIALRAISHETRENWQVNKFSRGGKLGITQPPAAGQVLYCDFSTGFIEPEMVKAKRPVIVIAPPIPVRQRLATVVCLSTVAPEKVMRYHLEVPHTSLPRSVTNGRPGWVKGDMVYTVSYDRLDYPTNGRDRFNKRVYMTKNSIGEQMLQAVHRCVLHSLGLGHITPHIGGDAPSDLPPK